MGHDLPVGVGHGHPAHKAIVGGDGQVPLGNLVLLLVLCQGHGGIYSSSGTNIFPQDIFRGTIILPYAQIFLRAFGAQFSK